MIPSIKLGGKDFSIPLLTPRQNRVVVPAVFRLMEIMKDPTTYRQNLTTAHYDDLIDLVFVACTKAQPMLKKDDFLNMDIPTKDLFDAIPVIMQQTGVVKVADPGEGAAIANP